MRLARPEREMLEQNGPMATAAGSLPRGCLLTVHAIVIGVTDSTSTLVFATGCARWLTTSAQMCTPKTYFALINVAFSPTSLTISPK